MIQSQYIKNIKVEDLVLWSENPRDRIDPDATDQDIVDMALRDNKSTWNLEKLAKEMGSHYDFSEIPTVVYHRKKPIVYDGNRRVALAKIKHGYVKPQLGISFTIPDIPKEIPCNVCTEDIALSNIERKHSSSGSWKSLERDIFLNKFRGNEKTAFLLLEENTGIVSRYSHLNQRFIRDEIFTREWLNEMGFFFMDGKLTSTHNKEEALSILLDISLKIKERKISTRENRGKVLDILDASSKELIEKNKGKKTHALNIHIDNLGDATISPQNSSEKNANRRRTRRTSKKEYILFGRELYLRTSLANDLYRDIENLYKYYISNKKALSQTFPNIIAMALRLLCESASKENSNKNIEDYLKTYFKPAKSILNQDNKTFLSSQNVTEGKIVELLQAYAHSYYASSNLQQIIAVSIVLGEILSITHKKGE